jgi:hypothetical protein
MGIMRQCAYELTFNQDVSLDSGDGGENLESSALDRGRHQDSMRTCIDWRVRLGYL